jgi:putative ABC transport system permease protein
VMREGLGLVGVGTILGLFGALGASRLLRSALYGAEGSGFVFLAVPILLMTVSAFAIWNPARRAAGVDPILALRSE